MELISHEAASIRYYEFECVSVFASVIQHANCIFAAPYYIVICSLSGSTIFFHTITNGMIFIKKNSDHKTRVLIFSTTFI
jgi:hypothetical protein